MGRYLIRRLIQTIPLLIVISIISFLVMHLSPGDPVAMFMNPEKGTLTPEETAVLREKLGLDRPLYVQYMYWLKNIFEGDWGFSLISKHPVKDEILSRLSNTIILGASAFIIALLVAIPIGTLSAIKQYSTLDYVATTSTFFGISIPSFWLGLVFIQLFARKLGWFPSVGMHSVGEGLVGFAAIVDILHHLVLPAIVLSMIRMAQWLRYQRSAMLEVLGLTFIVTARSKGLKERQVIIRHALKNALIPVITVIGLALPDIVNGSYVVEIIFGWPGMGRLGVSAVLSRDYPLIMGVTMVSSLVVAAGNLLADIAYAFLDPRIRYD